MKSIYFGHSGFGMDVIHGNVAGIIACLLLSAMLTILLERDSRPMFMFKRAEDALSLKDQTFSGQTPEMNVRGSHKRYSTGTCTCTLLQFRSVYSRTLVHEE